MTKKKTMNIIKSYFQYYICIKERKNFPKGFKNLPHRLEEAYKAGFELGKAMYQQNNNNKTLPLSDEDVQRLEEELDGDMVEIENRPNQHR